MGFPPFSFSELLLGSGWRFLLCIFARPQTGAPGPQAKKQLKLFRVISPPEDVLGIWLNICSPRYRKAFVQQAAACRVIQEF
jgi:hypothetical protein